MPGLIIAIVMKQMKNNMKVIFMKRVIIPCFFKRCFKKIEFEHRDNSKRHFYS